MTSDALKREIDFDIPAKDGKDILCRLNYAGDTPSDKAVILAHGLTGHVNEYIHLAARDFFNARGYDVYRISFYCDGENNRNLQDTTLQIHANDLNDLIAHIEATKKYKKLFVCGHSYGGATMLFANPNATAITFWDSTMYPWEGHWENALLKCTPYKDGFIDEAEAIAMYFGNKMIDEAKNNPIKTMKNKTKNINAPSLVSIAEYGDFEGRKCKELFDNLTCEKDYTFINGADHCFTNGDTVQNLLQETHKWFERF